MGPNALHKAYAMPSASFARLPTWILTHTPSRLKDPPTSSNCLPLPSKPAKHHVTMIILYYSNISNAKIQCCKWHMHTKTLCTPETKRGSPTWHRVIKAVDKAKPYGHTTKSKRLTWKDDLIQAPSGKHYTYLYVVYRARYFLTKPSTAACYSQQNKTQILCSAQPFSHNDMSIFLTLCKKRKSRFQQLGIYIITDYWPTFIYTSITGS